METCDVLILGGGPAGAACAWHLRDSSLDVLVMDRAQFPRDKICAGWITPQVIDELQIDIDDYRQQRTFQPISGFRVGLIDSDPVVEVSYGRPVSFGIRRCEFDTYLLRRTGARLALGTPVNGLRRDGAFWIVNDHVKARVIVGAGGHTCPVARLMNPVMNRRSLVAAQERELFLAPAAARACAADGEVPELYFSPDLSGYGWCFRKQQYVNIGLGQLDAHDLPRATNRFAAFLRRTGRIPADLALQWHGHAYLVAASTPRRIADDGVLLAGDAAGLAYPQSGEGIRPAVESGLMAASSILAAKGRYTRDHFQQYARELHQRFGQRPIPSVLSSVLSGVSATAARVLLSQPRFVRHVVLDRWFLHRRSPVVDIRVPPDVLRKGKPPDLSV